MKQEYIDLIRKHPDVDNQVLEFLCSNRKKYIYGNGAQTATCIALFREMDVTIDGVICLPGYEMPERKGYWGDIFRTVSQISLEKIVERDLDSICVLITVPREHYEEAESLLERIGFKNVYTCAWKRNQILRDICLSEFYKQEA